MNLPDRTDSNGDVWRCRVYPELDLYAEVRVNPGVNVAYRVYKVIPDEEWEGEGDRFLFLHHTPDKGKENREAPTGGDELFDGVIKWDGCSDNYPCHYLHGCSRKDVTRIGKVFDHLFDWAIEILGPDTRENLT